MTDYDDLAWNQQPGPWPQRPPDPAQVRQVMATWMNDLNQLEDPMRNPDDIPRPTGKKETPASVQIANSVGCVVVIALVCATIIAVALINAGVRS